MTSSRGPPLGKGPRRPGKDWENTKGYEKKRLCSLALRWKTNCQVKPSVFTSGVGGIDFMSERML